MREITSLDELKRIEYDILCKVDKFCTEHNIEYFLSHGTLLGAIRHNGFIPWDDDIDIYMKRSEYERFCKAFQAENTDTDLQFVNAHTELYYGRAMGKVIDTRTIVKETEFMGDDPIGVFIDIWVLDGAPDSQRAQNIHLKLCKFLMRLYYLRIRNPKTLKGWRRFLHTALALCVNPKIMNSYIEGLHKKYSDTQSDALVCYTDPYGKIIPADWFAKSADHMFEDQEFKVPSQYHRILTKIYGDYMKLPPEDKRTPHHVMNTYWKE